MKPKRPPLEPEGLPPKPRHPAQEAGEEFERGRLIAREKHEFGHSPTDDWDNPVGVRRTADEILETNRAEDLDEYIAARYREENPLRGQDDRQLARAFKKVMASGQKFQGRPLSELWNAVNDALGDVALEDDGGEDNLGEQILDAQRKLGLV